MEKLINYLLQFGQLNQQQIELVRNKAQETELKKEAYFSEAGKIPRRVAFINEGILRVCFYNSSGNQITKYFMDENSFAVDINSYTQKIPSSEYVQAVTDCKLIIFSREALDDLSATIIQWDSIISKITAKALVDKVNKLSPMLNENAKVRYLSFLDKFPQLANRIPLSFLASYLGITQSSLSRIRKNIR